MDVLLGVSEVVDPSKGLFSLLSLDLMSEEEFLLSVGLGSVVDLARGVAGWKVGVRKLFSWCKIASGTHMSQIEKSSPELICYRKSTRNIE